MVTSDYHIPYQDDKAISLMLAYAKVYKPSIFVINGDLVDFYSMSKFDKNPEHYRINDELDIAKDYLSKIKRVIGSRTKYYLLEGNHEVRLQKYLWKNKELMGIRELEVQNLLGLKDYGFEFVGADPDYWKSTSGTLKLGDVVIMHGDKRLNGGSYSKYAGYSAKNTVYSTMQNIIMGHTHRLAIINFSGYNKNLVGVEGGCLCKDFETTNWQQGFVTFDLIQNHIRNIKLHQIIKEGKKYKLFEDKKLFEA